MNNNLLIMFGGVFHLGFAVFHLFFWRLFRWKKDLAQLTYINRAVMQILNLCLTFVFIAAAYLSFFYSVELISSPLGQAVLILISAFWFLRIIEQLVFFGLRKRLSVILTLLFVMGCIIYIVPVLQGIS